MDRASSLTFPGSRTLAGWWRQLQPHRPRALWVGYWYLHRVEAPVASGHLQPLDPIARHLLRVIAALERDPAGCRQGECVQALQDRLHLPAGVLRHLLAAQERAGLLARSPAGGWAVTAAGREAIERGAYRRPAEERRVFPFAERPDPAGGRREAPHFVPVAECPAAPWAVPDDARFDPALLAQAVAREEAWKRAYGFPADVQHIETDQAAAVEGVSAQAALPRQRVLLDRPERPFLAFALGPADEVFAFAVRPDGWVLSDRAPVLTLPAAAARVAWPEFGHTPGGAELKDAWRAWCRQRTLPGGDVEECQLSYHDDHVAVQAPPRLVQRLQAARSDILKGEAWVLLGAGHVRHAVALRLDSAVPL